MNDFPFAGDWGGKKRLHRSWLAWKGGLLVDDKKDPYEQLFRWDCWNSFPHKKGEREIISPPRYLLTSLSLRSSHNLGFEFFFSLPLFPCTFLTEWMHCYGTTITNMTFSSTFIRYSFYVMVTWAKPKFWLFKCWRIPNLPSPFLLLFICSPPPFLSFPPSPHCHMCSRHFSSFSKNKRFFSFLPLFPGYGKLLSAAKKSHDLKKKSAPTPLSKGGEGETSQRFFKGKVGGGRERGAFIISQPNLKIGRRGGGAAHFWPKREEKRRRPPHPP